MTGLTLRQVTVIWSTRSANFYFRQAARRSPAPCVDPEPPLPEMGRGKGASARKRQSNLRSRGCDLVPHRGQDLAAEQLDAGEDVVLAHPRPAHAHRKVVDAAAMVSDQHIGDS